jgi:acetate kinase
MDAQSFGVLTINTGSSSLKAAVFRIGDREERLIDAEARQIGLESGRITISDGSGQKLLDRKEPLGDHRVALEQVLVCLRDKGWIDSVSVVGHRVVHGGQRYTAPARIDETLLGDLRGLVPLAPEHLPQAIAAIEKMQEVLPDVLQIACFDTAFHATLPRRARILALPRALSDEGIVRFGFHGLSCEFLVEHLRTIDPAGCGGRAVLAHLGNGASLSAVRDGRSIDTSMGFTPAGGIVMGTRSGDLDPGVLVYLLASKGFTSDRLDELVNREAGLMGISSISADMRILLERRDDARAAEAVETFCYQARKFLGAYAAALGGLDTIVFSGGIGENAPYVREQICAGLEFLGVSLDPERNAAGGEVISADNSRVTVRVIKTDEDLMIARHSCRLLADKEDS